MSPFPPPHWDIHRTNSIKRLMLDVSETATDTRLRKYAAAAAAALPDTVEDKFIPPNR